MEDHRPPEEVLRHYETAYDEGARLSERSVEALRTFELIGRYLPDPPARVLDVGGGTGFYARRLTAAGYEVHLVDPVLRHVEAASQAADGLPPPASASLGDARSLSHDVDSFAAVLMLGPLYHLPDRGDRVTALREAARVAVPGGPVLAAAISRFASAIDGLERRLLDDPEFVGLMQRDLEDGQHRNDTDDPRYFTTAFFHHPDELRSELAETGLTDVRILAIEGISWAADDLAELMAEPDNQAIVLDIVRRTEAEPTLLGASRHLMGVGRA